MMISYTETISKDSTKIKKLPETVVVIEQPQMFLIVYN